LENSWSNFKTSVSESLVESCPTVRNRTLPWISNESLQIRDRRCEVTRKRERNFLHRELKRSLKKDKADWLNNRVTTLQNAANLRDSRKMYQVVNELSGKKRSPLLSSVLSLIDEKLSEADKRLEQWAEHFNTLLNRPAPPELEDFNLEDDDVRNLPESPLVDTAEPTGKEVKKVRSN